jgi:predicted secreted protein
MRKILILISVGLLLTISLLPGCGGGNDEKIPDALKRLITETVNTRVNQEFKLLRQFDLSSGYMWRETYDEDQLELLQNPIETANSSDGSIILYQAFVFRALKKGTALITLEYERASLGGPTIAKTELVQVNIR